MAIMVFMNLQKSSYILLSVIAVSTMFVTEATAGTVTCGHNETAKKLANLIIEDPAQQRTKLECNETLVSIAQQRAEQLAKNTADPNITPNQVVIKGGFRVPSYYPVSGNQVEALARDYTAADQVIAYFTNTDKHHDHVLGKGEFFSLQSQMGVGYFQSDDAFIKDQWVVLIVEPWQSPKITFKQNFNTPYKVEKGCEKGWEKSKDPYLFKKCSPKSAKKLMFIQ